MCDRGGVYGSVRLHQEVVAVRRSQDAGGAVYEVDAVDPRDGSTTTRRARRLVLGVGSSPYRPPEAAGLEGAVWHSSDFLHVRDRLREAPDVTVVGSGQSAAEVVRDLLSAPGSERQRLRWVTRSARFFPTMVSGEGVTLSSDPAADGVG